MVHCNSKFRTGALSHCLVSGVKQGNVAFGQDVHTLSQQVAPKLTEYKDLFDNNTIGRLPVVYHMSLDDPLLLIVCTPRRVPMAMRD